MAGVGLMQWRKFNFFDIKTNIDGGKLSEYLKGAAVTCTAAGRGHVYIGDSNGFIHSVTRKMAIDSFQVSESPVASISAFDHTSIIITVSDNRDGPSYVKVWAPDRADTQGSPRCLRTLSPDPRPIPAGSRGSSGPRLDGKIPKVTALAVHPNLSMMALGFSDGAIMLYRGEVSRERGSKKRVLLTVSSGITNLHIRHSRYTHLFVTTHTHVYCVNCTVRDKETTVELDSAGCKQGCATLADGRHEHHLLVARPDAIYSYTVDSRGSCYVFEGEKSMVSWFQRYLLVASVSQGFPANRSDRTVTVYDLTNKLVALSVDVCGLAGAVGEWGSLYLITTEPAMTHISEKDLQSKFQLLFRKNQFDIAISLAKTQCCDQEEVAEILRQYGDWLYDKANHTLAMDQYIKAIPHLEPSYIIRKYLDTQHIQNLTTYLQALHRAGCATADHTSLLLNCYTRLRDTQQLDEFILSKEGALDCDVELGVRVCRSAGYYDHALTLAAKHGLHHHYLTILIDDKKDHIAALRYISTLEYEEAKTNILRYGSVLLTHVPDETTELLIRMCTDYKPSNSPIIKEGSLDGYLTPEEPTCADPEDFEFLLVGHSEQTIKFLEKMEVTPNKISPKLYTTLLAEYLHQYSLAPEGQEQVALGMKVMGLIRNSNIAYSRDDALLMCNKYQFHDGKVYLWEQAGMFEELLAWYAEQGDMASVFTFCEKKSEDAPQLWCSALKLLTSSTSVIPPEPQHLMTCLDHIDQKRLLPPLEVVDMLAASPHVTLGQVREYLLKVVSAHSSSLESEVKTTQQCAEETTSLRESINNIRSSATQFTATKCNICNGELELPSVHFLCRHSFHHHCFESYSESDADCPICLPENRKMLETVKLLDTRRSQHDVFHEQLERSSDSFFVVAEYLGRGIFTPQHSLATMYPPLNTTKDVSSVGPVNSRDVSHDVPDANAQANIRVSHTVTKHEPTSKVPETEGRIRALERLNKGPVGVGGEGRLRMGERHGQGILEIQSEARLRSEAHNKSSGILSPTEGRVRSGIASNVVVPAPESRIRSAEKARKGGGNDSGRSSRASNQFSPSLQDHITVASSTSSQERSPKRDLPIESITSMLSKSHITQPTKTASDNPFEDNTLDSSNPFSDDYATEDMASNPFEVDYDESKNPFAAEDSPKSKSPELNNPFRENADDYDSQLNPFGAN